MTDRELLQQALDAVNALTKELLACKDELAERGARPENLHKQKLWDSAFNAYIGMAIPTYEAIRARLAQPNDFNPDWDAMAVMVEEQQRMAKRIEELEGQLAQPEPESIGQHEFIDTTAKWGRDFVEVLNPLEENAILRFYHEPPQQPEPKPVAWMWNVYSGAGYTSRGIDFFPTDIPFAKHTPLYTAPQREWVGLTDDDIDDVQSSVDCRLYRDYARAIEAMQMALDWFHWFQHGTNPNGAHVLQVEEALRTALAQPEPATRVPEGDIRALKHRIHELEGEVIGYKQILDTQPEPAECDGGQCGIGGYCKDCPKTKPELKIINMENFVGSGKPLVPVCWMNANDIDKTDWKVWAHGKPTVSMPLFASPPQREWVGMTDAEVEKVFFDMGQFAKIDLKTFARAIEAKLKEKNT